MKKTVVAGVGHRHRRDDGVGPAVLEQLRGRLPSRVEARDLGSDPLKLFDVFDDAGTVIVVDAVQGTGEAGRVATWTGEQVLERSKRLRGVTSSHGIDVAAVFALAQRLDRLPARLDVVAVEVKDVSRGEGLSPAVRAALEPAARAVLDLLCAQGFA